MGNKMKKLISMLAAATLVGSTFAFVGCKDDDFSLDANLAMPAATKAVSNGGFAVEKGGYVYFINGQGMSDDDNEYGEVQKASLMRISNEDLANGNYDKSEMVVPMLFVSGNMDSGIYIHDDYVYFATPTTGKDISGNVIAGSLDFKRAKLDGSEVMSDCYFRTSTNSVQYRFVKGSDEKIYCMYVDNGALKSYNVTDGKETVLVKGAASGFIFDSNQDNGTVYYTMNVPNMFFGTDDQTNESYTQIYRVKPTATVSVDEDEAKYIVTGEGYTNVYDFNEDYFEEKNEEAKEKDKDADLPYDLSDYTTYGYVNLGELVVDGIGASKGEFAVPNDVTEQFHNMEDYNEAKEDASFVELKGYTYSLQSYQNGGIYFTRSLVQSTQNDPNNLYYLADKDVDGQWNSVLCNENDSFTVVSNDTTKASSTAAYYIDEAGVHHYLYVTGDKLMRATQPSAGVEEVEIAKKGFTSRQILYIRDNYLYTYTTDMKGLYRIDYTGSADDYHGYAGDKEYTDVQILKIEFNTAWYKPEFFGNVLLYNNAQTVNGISYNYINAVNLAGSGENGAMTVAELTDLNEKYTEVTDHINALKSDSNKKLSSAVMAYFRTGSTEAIDALVEEYGADALSDNDLVEFKAYVEKTVGRKPSTATQEANDYSKLFKEEGENGKYYNVESYFFGTIGQISDEDKEEMLQGWKDSVYTVTEDAEEEEEASWKWWHWVILSAGSVIVLFVGVKAFLYFKNRRKQAMIERMRSSKPRRKIDTTDDKSIDVYADDEAEEIFEETEEIVDSAEEAVEESVEETSEEVIETEENTEE